LIKAHDQLEGCSSILKVTRISVRLGSTVALPDSGTHLIITGPRCIRSYVLGDSKRKRIREQQRKKQDDFHSLFLIAWEYLRELITAQLAETCAPAVMEEPFDRREKNLIG
jgi:hypothetical protein